MAAKMTSRQRFGCVLDHKEPDRVPIIDTPWSSTLERWRQQGMPLDVGPAEFFDWDRIGGIGINNSPSYPTSTIDETDEYIQAITGATISSVAVSESVRDAIKQLEQEIGGFEEAGE